MLNDGCPAHQFWCVSIYQRWIIVYSGSTQKLAFVVWASMIHCSGYCFSWQQESLSICLTPPVCCLPSARSLTQRKLNLHLKWGLLNCFLGYLPAAGAPRQPADWPVRDILHSSVELWMSWLFRFCLEESGLGLPSVFTLRFRTSWFSFYRHHTIVEIWAFDVFRNLIVSP